MSNEWIGYLKKGDKVIVVSDGRRETIGTVTKVTPTGRIVVGTTTYNTDGTERGAGAWHWSCIREFTVEKGNEIEAKRRKGELSKEISNSDLRWLTVEECETIVEIIRKSNQRNAERV